MARLTDSFAGGLRANRQGGSSQYDGSTVSAPEPIPVDRFQEAAELRRRLRSFLSHADATVRGCGLTPQRYLLLLAIKGAPDGSQSRTVGDLAGDLGLAQSSATELVDRAAAAGLVERGDSPDDGRVVWLRLSEHGEQRLAEAFVALHEERHHLLAQLDHARRLLDDDGP
jgi:DNA-binding MarR family transcriptional regulator